MIGSVVALFGVGFTIVGLGSLYSSFGSFGIEGPKYFVVRLWVCR